MEILLFTGPAESPLGRFFVIEHGGSGRVARAVGPGAKRSSAPPFLRKKDFQRPRHYRCRRDACMKTYASNYIKKTSLAVGEADILSGDILTPKPESSEYLCLRRHRIL